MYSSIAGLSGHQKQKKAPEMKSVRVRGGSDLGTSECFADNMNQIPQSVRTQLNLVLTGLRRK